MHGNLFLRVFLQCLMSLYSVTCLGFNLSGWNAVDRTVVSCPFEGRSAMATLKVAEVMYFVHRLQSSENWSFAY